MGKGKIVLIVILVIIALLAIGGYAAYSSATGSPTREAFVSSASGNVQVDAGNGWVAATAGQELGANDKVKTNEGTAVIVLQESVIVRLKAGTEVTIAALAENNIKIKQSSGETWNKFTGLSGVDGYAVETPTTVATVRGTGFLVGNGGSELIIGDGTVEWSAGGETITATKLQKWTHSDDVSGFDQGTLTAEEKAELRANILADVETLKQLRWDEATVKHPTLYGQAKQRFGFGDEQVKTFFDDLDAGRETMDNVKANAPITIASLDKIDEYSKEIKKQLIILDELEQ